MKRLLLLFTLFSSIYFSFSQTPTNESIENAIEITLPNYSESDIRLDLASVSPGLQVSCSTNGFNVVYYKFTATEDVNINAALSATSVGGAIVNSFVIAYNAPNLNVTSEDELSQVASSFCQFGTQTNFGIINGQSYYVLVHRSDADALTNFTVSQPLDVPESERTALINFYNAMGGSNWINNTNWNTASPVSTWHGVFTTTTDLNGQPFEDGLDHVYGLNFFENNNITGVLPVELAAFTKLRNIIIRDNNITGNIPNEVYNLPDMLQIQLQGNNMSGSMSSNIQNLTNLQVLDIRNNDYSGVIPDLTSLINLQFLNIENNNFMFGDFESEFTDYQNTISNFTFTPQQNQDQNHIVEQTLSIGDDITLNSASVSGENTYYQWYLGVNAISGANATSLELTDIQLNELGVYQCYAFNTLIPGLVIRTGISTLNGSPNLNPDYDALIALYNSTDGDNWVNNTNWLSDEPINTWYGIGTLSGDGNSRVTSIYLGYNNLSGNIPEEIGDFSNLFNLGLSGNNLSGEIPQSIVNLNLLGGIELQDNNFSGVIPDLSNNPNLIYFYIWNNNFVFGDFENEFSVYQTLGNDFIYTPQKLLNAKPDILTTNGEQISVSANVSGAQNNYFWFKRNDDATNTLISNLETLEFTLDDSNAGTYFLEVSSTLVPNLLLTSPDFSIGQDPTLSPDYNALVDLYNSTNGANWSNNTNWNNLNVPLSEWYGLTVVNNRVTVLSTFYNNLVGSIPNSILNLTEAETLDFGQNKLSGSIPDFSVLSNLQILSVSNNDYDFLDLETNYANNATLPTFSYSPQKLRDEAVIIDGEIGEDYSFNMSAVDGTDVQYQWYTISTFDQSGDVLQDQNTNALSLLNFQNENYGAYACYATNSAIPDLIIKRETVEIKGPVSQVERDALVAIYNATGGPNWFNTVNWNTAEPVSTWTGVTITGNKVTGLGLQSFNPNGSMPNDLANLVHLETLYIGLYDFGLTGSIPENIGNLTQLKRFWIQTTGMSGEIPQSIGGLSNLTELRFLGNNFYGSLPESMGNLTELTSLLLNGTEYEGVGSDFSGELTTSFENLSNLTALDLSKNSFEGELPTSLSNISNATFIGLSENNFSGTLPFNNPNAHIDISNNIYDFSDIEPFSQAGNYGSLVYSPQRTDDIEENIESGVGADITLNVNDTNLNRDGNDTAMNNIYQWYKDDIAIISGGNNADLIITNAQTSDSGIYHCEITNSILPDLIIVRAPITLFIDPNLSVIDAEANEISMYPNPVKNWLNIKTSALTNAKLSIYDISGRLVMSKLIQGNLNAVSVETLQSGTYILKLEHKNMMLTKRFIKN